jgi:hypothetical protein
MTCRQFSIYTCALAGLCGIVLAQTPAPVAAPWQQVNVQGAFAGKRTFPVLTNNYLVAHARQVNRKTGNAVFVTSLTGQKIAFPLSIPGATTIRVEHGTLSPAGHILLAGAYVKSDQFADELNHAPIDAVNFIAEVDMTGKLLSVRNLGDFTPTRLCAASDGSWWALGEVWPDEIAGRSSYATLRQYSPDGTLKASYLPRSALVQKTLNLHEHDAGAQYAFLRCGTSSVGAYIGSGIPGGNFTFVEVNGGQAQVFTVGHTAGSKFPGIITGIALLAPHVAYATFSNGGLYRLVFGPSNAATWTQVPLAASAAAAATNSKISFLLGSSGSNLIHLMGNVSPDPNKTTTLYWTAVSQ